MNELDAPLGLSDTAHDRACNRAAVAVFGLTAVAIIGGAVGWFTLRGAPASDQRTIEFTGSTPSAATVSADMPVLRQELREDSASASVPEPSRSITIIDGKTGKRETIQFDADDKAIGSAGASDGIMPAAADADAAPSIVR